VQQGLTTAAIARELRKPVSTCAHYVQQFRRAKGKLAPTPLLKTVSKRSLAKIRRRHERMMEKLPPRLSQSSWDYLDEMAERLRYHSADALLERLCSILRKEQHLLQNLLDDDDEMCPLVKTSAQPEVSRLHAGARTPAPRRPPPRLSGP